MTTQILPTDTGDLGEGLQARIADPLWMLFRQWTVRELTGESVGTPTRLTMKVELADFGDAPLEAEIEAESVLRDPVQRFRIAAETGRVLLSGATPTRALELQQAFPLTPADNSMRARLWSKTGMDGLSALASSELAAHERIRTSSWLEANYGIVPTGRWLPDQLAKCQGASGRRRARC